MSERIDKIEQAFRDLAKNTGKPLREAAEDVMALIRAEAKKKESQEERNLPEETFGSLSYNPAADETHPMYGWRP